MNELRFLVTLSSCISFAKRNMMRVACESPCCVVSGISSGNSRSFMVEVDHR